MFQISLDELRQIQNAANVLSSEPTKWEPLSQLPEDLISVWRSYIQAKKTFNNVLSKYDINPIL